jgi:hypothetical protein
MVATSGDLAPWTPARRLAWDALDAGLRSRRGEDRRRGFDEAVVMRGMRGAGSNRGHSFQGLDRFGYSPLAEADFRPMPLPAAGGATTLGCWSFDPGTDRSDCLLDCWDEMAETTGTSCDVYLDCGRSSLTLSGAELDDLATGFRGDEDLGFKRGPRITGATESEEAFITAAWNLILANLDLVAWAVCKVEGSVDTAEFGRLLDCLNGKLVNRVTIWVWDVGGTMLAVEGSGTIIVGRDGEVWTKLIEMWARGDDNTRLCACIIAAKAFLHEVTHLAGYTYADLWHEAGNCYASIMIGNAFGWAMHHRYPHSVATSCCNHLQQDSDFGCGRSGGPDDCSIGAADWTDGYFHGGGSSSGEVLESIWNAIRWVIGVAVGAVRRALRELAQLIADAAARAWDAVTDWASDTWQKIVEWGGRLVTSLTIDGGGGGCGCDCEPCYSYCPTLWRSIGNSCIPALELDHPAMTRCIAECGLGELDGKHLSTEGVEA